MSPPAPILAPGTLLRRTYEVVGQIASGGMGQVFEARHARLPGRFAIKVLSTDVPPDSPEMARFRREAEIASSLRHPNIVQVVDFDQTPEGVPFLVMELLEGRDLAAELAACGRLPLGRVIAIVEQVASAVGAAHGRGVVHRDLKPQNIFLASVSGQQRELVKVVDFGISKVRSTVALTRESNLLGTPRYMAPEQARGLVDDVDGRSDQFALAAITYEALTGRPAFHGADTSSVLYQVVHEDPPPMIELPSERAAALEAVIRRALSKRKEARFLSVVEFAQTLAEAAGPRAGSLLVPAQHRTVTSPDAATVVAPVPRLPAPPSGSLRLSRVRRLVPAAVLIASGGLAAGMAWRSARRAERPPTAPERDSQTRPFVAKAAVPAPLPQSRDAAAAAPDATPVPRSRPWKRPPPSRDPRREGSSAAGPLITPEGESERPHVDAAAPAAVPVRRGSFIKTL